MKKRYMQFSYNSEPSLVGEKGISFRQLIYFLIAIKAITIAIKNGVSIDIIKTIAVKFLG